MDSATARPMTVLGLPRRLTPVILRVADRRSRLNPQLLGLAELSRFCTHEFRDCAPNDRTGASRRPMDSATARPMTVLGISRRLTPVILRLADRRPKAVILSEVQLESRAMNVEKLTV